MCAPMTARDDGRGVLGQVGAGQQHKQHQQRGDRQGRPAGVADQRVIGPARRAPGEPGQGGEEDAVRNEDNYECGERHPRLTEPRLNAVVNVDVHVGIHSS
jgi:hypothetical protein